MEIIKKIDIPLENMIGFGSDGANNVSSQNNSLWTKLNEAAGGNAYQFKCTCHSLALVMKDAWEALPEEILDVFEKVPYYFSNSRTRREEYKKFWDNHQNQQYEAFKTPKQKFRKPWIKHCPMRWLSYDQQAKVIKYTGVSSNSSGLNSTRKTR